MKNWDNVVLVPEFDEPVSYTHLDVYKRQCQDMFREFIFITGDKIRILFFEGRIVPGFCIGILHIEFFSEGFFGIV